MDNSASKSKSPLFFLHLAALIIPVVVLSLIYSNSFQAPFTFDDFINFVDKNTMQMKTLSYKSLYRAAFEGLSRGRWLPNLSFGLNYYFGRQEVWGYHLVNLVVHILATIVLYGLFFTTLSLPKFDFSRKKAWEISLVASLIWAAHPLQTNAVTYIVQRMTSMATLFYLAALLFYVRGRISHHGAGRYLYWLMGGVCAVLSLISKQNSAILPLSVLAYEIYFLGGRNRRINWTRFSATLVSALIGIFVIGWLYLGKNPLGVILGDYAKRDFTLVERLLTESRVIIHYLSLILLPLPSRLNFAYEFQISTSVLTPPETFLAIAAIAGLIFLIVCLFRNHRLLSFGLLWFLLNLAMESTIIPLEIIFEHRVYLPSTMLILSLTAFAYQIWGRRQQVLRVFWGAAVIVLCLFTWQRNAVWASEVTFWQDVVKKSPDLVRAYNYLGWAYTKEERYREAFDLYKMVEEKGFEDVDIYNNSGKAAFNLGMPEKAVELFLKAIEVDRFHPESHYNLGVAYGVMGKETAARREMALGMKLQQIKDKQLN